ncbi:beta-ketoacyl-ACP synthase III [Desulfuromonas acetoxidans]|uniref:Beta-ketoacyl-[acyl-carrier-protein] synthase III n=1 Tax=Desulfuromonas acetoxidans (strain DSM 684 / 11070) TaxID=281689 RepID=Q1K0L1_DESA6|nr:beta-ketoacyl-ACP synthase III [Desulfuromonas acetoxidans]EAT15930.1 3-oxoacyl-(acyl-carrier-protein) synthase III [Desulfuromonas acetoxidans DSM 684]
MKKARIIGTGSYRPEKVLTNFDLEKMVDTNNEWITARTGIKERRIAADHEMTSDLAVNAARKALEMAETKPEEIDLVIVGTITGDYPWPSTACLVQDKLGAVNAAAWDVSAACSGFVYALASATQYLESGHSKKALVIGAEVLSRIIDWEDRNTCILFGDGAGAVVLEAQEGEQGVLSTHLHSDGSYWELLYQPGFGARHPASVSGIEQRLPFLRMAGNEVFKVAVRSLYDVAIEALDANQMTAKDVDLLFPHQANRRILDAVKKRLKLNDDQMYVNVDMCGNTSGASIPLALDEANRNGQLNEGDVLLFDAFGGGFTWGAALVRW